MTDMLPSNELCTKLREGTGEYYRIDKIMEDAADEIERLQRCLATANANHEQFERLYYLERQKNEDSSSHEPATEHPPQLMAVVDKWQDNANSWREMTPHTEREDAALVDLILREIREAVSSTPPPSANLVETLRRIADPDFRYSSDDDDDTQLSLRMADARAALNQILPTQPPSVIPGLAEIHGATMMSSRDDHQVRVYFTDMEGAEIFHNWLTDRVDELVAAEERSAVTKEAGQ
jgi:predicted house-cleaning noncanonical NTP pyrophosphatase (MazG superfamily)